MPSAAGFDLYRDLAFSGGMPNVLFASVWAALRSSMVLAPPDDPGADPVMQLVERVDRGEGLAALDAGLYSEIELGGERAFDSPFWQERAPSRQLARVVRNRIPALLISGWFDVYQRGVPLSYAALQNAWAGRRRVFAPMRPRPGGDAALPVAPGPVAAQRRGDGGVDPEDPPGVVRPLALPQADAVDPHAQAAARLRAAARVAGSTPPRTRCPRRGRDGSGWMPGRATRPRCRSTTACSRAARPKAGSDQLPYADAASPCSRLTDQWSMGFLGAVSAGAGMPVNPCAGDDRSTQSGALAYTTPPLERAVSLAGPSMAAVLRPLEHPGQPAGGQPGGHRAGRQLVPAHERRAAGLAARARPQGELARKGKLVLPHHPYTQASRSELPPGQSSWQQIELPPVFARLERGHRLRLTLSTSAPHLHATAGAGAEPGRRRL